MIQGSECILTRRKATVKMATADRSDILQIKQQVYMEVVFSVVKPIRLEKAGYITRFVYRKIEQIFAQVFLSGNISCGIRRQVETSANPRNITP